MPISAITNTGGLSPTSLPAISTTPCRIAFSCSSCLAQAKQPFRKIPERAVTARRGAVVMSNRANRWHRVLRASGQADFTDRLNDFKIVDIVADVSQMRELEAGLVEHDG